MSYDLSASEIAQAFEDLRAAQRTIKELQAELERMRDDTDGYVAWLCYGHSGERQWLKLCDSDTPRAFRVYRHKEAIPTDFEAWADEKGITETARWWAREAWNEAIHQQ